MCARLTLVSSIEGIPLIEGVRGGCLDHHQKAESVPVCPVKATTWIQLQAFALLVFTGSQSKPGQPGKVVMCA